MQTAARKITRFMTSIDMGRSVWLEFDAFTETFCLWADEAGTDYIAESDDESGAWPLALAWFNQLMQR